ncbi:FeoA family protein [Brooklawnia propionicigenes]|uniref:FeoA family protein n=1 Tax=Brooklawnia propionicigenes TaxID=3041175 RepID=UPI00257247B5|nr:FeoA family protein [Brooklawnia sp. SH051]
MRPIATRLTDRRLGVCADSGCLPMGQLRCGQCGVIAGFTDHTDMAVSRRLFDLGFAQGVEVELLRRAPLRDPLMLRIGTSQMLLRASEANRVLVRPL